MQQNNGGQEEPIIFQQVRKMLGQEPEIPETPAPEGIQPEEVRLVVWNVMQEQQGGPSYRYQPDPVHADIASLRSAIRLQNMVINELKEMVKRFADEQLYMATDVSGAKERMVYLEQELAEARAKIADMSLLVPSIQEVEQSVRTSRTSRRWRIGWPWR